MRYYLPMRKYLNFKSCVSAVLLAIVGLSYAAPAPIKRGPLISGGTKQVTPAKVVAPAKSAPAKAQPPKAAPAKTAPAKAAPAKVVAPAKSAPAKVKAVPAKATPPKTVAEKPKAQVEARPAVASAAPRAPYRGAIAVDADTGRVLFADGERTSAYPASVTKLMTFLLVLEDLQNVLYGLNDRVEASTLAVSMEPSSVGLRTGQSMTVHDMLLSIMVKSANDAAEALAEHSAKARGCTATTPAELCAAFVERMNSKAQELGMRDTRYASPNGLPPPRGSKRGFDVSTAADLAKLGRVVVRMPKALEYTSHTSCKVTDGSGRQLTLSGHNYFIPGAVDPKRLCTPVEGCDGLKTGFTAASGCSIMLTARRNGRRVIVVVLGSAGRHERENAAERILRDSLGAISVW